MFLTREKEETLARPANYEATLWLPCLVAVAAAAAADVYLVARTIGTQDGKASPIYSARETGTLLRQDEKTTCGSWPCLEISASRFAAFPALRITHAASVDRSRFRINFVQLRSFGHTFRLTRCSAHVAPDESRETQSTLTTSPRYPLGQDDPTIIVLFV